MEEKPVPNPICDVWLLFLEFLEHSLDSVVKTYYKLVRSSMKACLNILAPTSPADGIQSWVRRCGSSKGYMFCLFSVEEHQPITDRPQVSR
jgi:hypothetical protein